MRSILLIGVASTILVQTTAKCVLNTGAQRQVHLAYAPEVSSGGVFAVRSASPISPTGVSVLSDHLVIEGPLVIDGQLPFLGTVALEGRLPSVGAGTIGHSCGAVIGINSEMRPGVPARGLSSPGRAPRRPPALGPGRIEVPRLGLGARGKGCGRLFK